MAADAVCRCICGTGEREPIDATTTWATQDVETDEFDEPLFLLPQFSGRLSYSMYPDQPLRGQPMREGELWFLSTEDKVDPVTFSLYINGFSFWHDDQETSISLCPFALVRNCKFQSTYPSLGSLSDFKIFKVSLFALGRCYYFGVRGADERQAEDARSRWVLDISRAMRLVTQSLYPPFVITCDPAPHVPSTKRRLMAGYLIHCDGGYVASVLYCELHPHCDDKAKIVMYESETCQTPATDVYITERSICCEKIGINCSCFSIEEHQFSTRSIAERKLWLRAISNLKVKLQNRAPTPAVEELRTYRESIREHLGDMKGALECSAFQTEPLLQRCAPRKQPPSPSSFPAAQEAHWVPPEAANLAAAHAAQPSLQERVDAAGVALAASTPTAKPPAAGAPMRASGAPEGALGPEEVPQPATLSRPLSTIGPRVDTGEGSEVHQPGDG